MKKKSLKKKAIQAGIWLFARKFSTKIINLAAIYILARKLTPSDFGLVALANVALRLVTGSISQTTSTYIIYDNSEDWQDKANTGFWLNILLIIGVFVILYPSLPWLVSFYHGGVELKKIILVFFIVFIFLELRSIPDAFLKKKLLYNKLVLRDTVLDILGAILSVVMALKGYGVWSLVIPVLITSFISLPVSFIQSRWFPSLPSLLHAKEILKYTVHVMGTNILTFLGNEGDTLITGKLLGFNKLGIYNRAYASANLIIKNIKSVISEIAFPALSSTNVDKTRTNRAFLKMLEILALLGFPLTMGLMILSKEFILVLYGNQWIKAIIPMQILLIMALRRIVGSPIGTYFNAIGKPQIMFKFGVFFTPIYLLSVLIGAFYGIIGVATAVTLIRTTGGIIMFILLSKEMQQPISRIFSIFKKPFFYSTIMLLGIFLFKKLFLPHNTALTVLILGSIVGISIYSILILLDSEYRSLVFSFLKS